MHLLIKIGALVLTVVVLIASPRPAAAQSATWWADWSCGGSNAQFEQCKATMGATSGTGGPFSSLGACEAWAGHTPQGARCRSLGGSTSETSTTRTTGSGSAASFGISHATAGQAMRQPAFWGAIVGALAGSFSKMPNGNSWAGPAAVGGAGAFTSLSVLMNAKRWPLLAAPIIGAEAGALLGAAYGAVEDGKIIKGSDNDLGEPSKVGPNAAKFAEAGAAAALLLHFVAPSQSFRTLPIVRNVRRPDSRVTILQRGDRMGVSVAW